MRLWMLNRMTIALTCSLGLPALSSCSNAERSFGGGVFSKGNVVTTVLDDVGVIVKNEGPKEYKQRPPLAIPNSTDSLPEPESGRESVDEATNGQDSAPVDVTTDTEITYNDSAVGGQDDASDRSGNVGEGAPGSGSSQGADPTESGNGGNTELEGVEQQETGVELTDAECEIVPGVETDSCHLIRPPEGYN